jgi:SulP family sulfate permease
LIVATIAAVITKSQLNLEVPTIGIIPQSLPIPQSIPHWNDFGVIRELINPAIAAILQVLMSLSTALQCETTHLFLLAIANCSS